MPSFFSQKNEKWLTMERIWWWAAKPGDTDQSFWEGLDKVKKHIQSNNDFESIKIPVIYVDLI